LQKNFELPEFARQTRARKRKVNAKQAAGKDNYCSFHNSWAYRFPLTGA
jgi:hypothetical protein